MSSEKKRVRGEKMTSKKSKQYDITNKTPSKYKPKQAAAEKKNKNTKKIDTFLPIPKEEKPKKQQTATKK